MSGLFNTFFFTPLFNFLVFLYSTAAFNDFGIAIILLTLIIRFILSPLSIKTIKSQKALAELQPKIKEIQEKYKADPQKQAQKTMELYRENKVNPFSGCLPLLIQLPILIALYQVSTAGFQADPISLGFIDLTKRNIPLALVAGITQFFQAKTNISSQKGQILEKKSPNSSPFSAMNQQMLYFFPLITIIISISFPAGLPLYWITTTVFSILEQVYINKIYGKSGESDRKLDSKRD
ncbi:MAG: YidC/Oxa1 family membrane protein insertase [Patescibacteria group bacterium]